MSTLMSPAERIAAAGCSRAAASFDVAGSEYAGSQAFAAAAFRGWGSNPTQGMPVNATKRHLTPAPRPEEASP
ncbi:MAG TPA: hypothetical protein VF228_13285 [Iamia sp.]|jgi:hypothetical protein